MQTSIRKEWVYLTDSAACAVCHLMHHGIKDRDLALAILELLWDDDEIYSLDDPDGFP